MFYITCLTTHEEGGCIGQNKNTSRNYEGKENHISFVYRVFQRQVSHNFPVRIFRKKRISFPCSFYFKSGFFT